MSEVRDAAAWADVVRGIAERGTSATTRSAGSTRAAAPRRSVPVGPTA